MNDVPLGNPFQTEEAWNVSTGTMLTEGDHFCHVTSVNGSGTSSGGYPQIEIEVGNAEGSIRDWIVVIPTSIGRVVQLTDACGLPRPTDEQVEMEPNGYRLDAEYLEQLVGKAVGVIVRAEPDRLDPTRTRDRVKGYVTPDQVQAPPLTGTGSADAFQDKDEKKDIPF
jgi:hypothetical protein